MGQNTLVLGSSESREDVALLRPKNHHGLSVVMLLEDTALVAVEDSERSASVALELVVRTAMVDVMTETGDQKGQTLEFVES